MVGEKVKERWFVERKQVVGFSKAVREQREGNTSNVER